MVAISRHHEPFRKHGADLGQTHQTCDPLFTAGDAGFLEFGEDAWTAVGLFALLMGGLDLLGQSFVLKLARTLFAFTPGVEAASTDLHNSTERTEGELLLVLFNEEVSHWGRTVKIPTAFLGSRSPP